MEHKEYRSINRSVRKKDSMQLLLGKPVYTDDVTPNDALVVKILRSPHANAIVESIDTAIARKVPGVVDIYTWEDVPQTRFAIAGQTFPEPSPYDRLIIDRHVRFCGDVVAIIAAETEKAALKAMKLIKVKYQVLEAVLDPRTAKDHPVLVHPEEDWFPPCQVGGDPKRNLVASADEIHGDVEGIMAQCDIVLERTYHTKAYNQAMRSPLPPTPALTATAVCTSFRPPRSFSTPAASCPGRWASPKARSVWKSPGSAAVSVPNRLPSAMCILPSSP